MKGIVILLIFGFLMRVGGFVRELLIAYYFGASSHADNFFLSMTLPNIMLNMIAPAIGIAFIPLFIKYYEKRGEFYSWQFANYIVKKVFVFSLVVSFVVLIIVLLFPILDHNPQLKKMVLLTSPLILLYSMQVIFIYICHANKNFSIGSNSSLIQLTISILGITLFFNQFGIYSITLSIFLGSLFQLTYLIYNLKKVKFFLFKKRKICEKKESIKPFYVSILGVGVGLGSYEMIFSLDRIFGSFFYDGLVSSLNYSYKLLNIPIMIIVFAFASAFFPKINSIIVKGENSNLGNTLDTLLGITILLILPLIFLYNSLNIYIIDIVFRRGEFTYDNVVVTSTVMESYLYAIFGIAVTMILYRIQYALGKNYSAIFMGLSSIFFVLLLNLVSVAINSINLLLNSTPIIIMLIAIVQFITLRKYFTNYKKLLILFLQILFLSIGTSVFVRTIFISPDVMGSTLNNLIYIMKFSITYLLLMFAILSFMRNPFLFEIYKIINNKIRKR